MAIRAADLETRLFTNDRDYKRGFQEAERTASRFVTSVNSKLTGLGKGFSLGRSLGVSGGVIPGLANITQIIQGIPQIGQLAGALINPLTDAVEEGVRFNMLIESAEIGFKGITGSAEASRKYVKELTDFAAANPIFNTRGTIEAARMMAVFGFETQKTTDYLKAWGGAIAAGGQFSNETLQGVARAFGQMTQKGRVSAEEMEQLAERGIPAWELLAKAIGKSVAETRKLSEEGKLRGPAAVDAITAMLKVDPRFAGQVEAFAKSTEGMLAQIQDIREVAQGKATEGLTQDFNAVLAKATSGTLPAQIQTLAQTINTAITPISGLLKAGISGALEGGITGGFAAAVGAANEMLGGLGLSTITGYVGGITSGLASIAEAGKSAVQSFVSGVTDELSTVSADNAVEKTTGYFKTGLNMVAGGGSIEAGKAVTEGFAKGINDGLDVVKSAGAEVGGSAIKATKTALDSNSPSMEFYAIGVDSALGFSDGFANGFNLIAKPQAVKSIQELLATSRKAAGGSALPTTEDSTFKPLTAPQVVSEARQAQRPTVEIIPEITGPDMRPVGRSTAEGFAKGVNDGLGIVSSAAASLGITAIKATKLALDSQSPSMKFHAIGEDAARGMADGFESAMLREVTPRIQQSIDGLIAGAYERVMSPGQRQSFRALKKLTEKEPEFLPKLIREAKERNINPDDLLNLMALETAHTFSPAKTNRSGYTGLIQFGAPAAKDLGTTTSKLRAMSATEQLDFVFDYLDARLKQFYKDGVTAAQLYASVGAGHATRNDETVFFRRGGYQQGDDPAGRRNNLSGRGYESNFRSWDVNGDQVIQQWEFGDVIQQHLGAGRLFSVNGGASGGRSSGMPSGDQMLGGISGALGRLADRLPERGTPMPVTIASGGEFGGGLLNKSPRIGRTIQDTVPVNIDIQADIEPLKSALDDVVPNTVLVLKPVQGIAEGFKDASKAAKELGEGDWAEKVIDGATKAGEKIKALTLSGIGDDLEYELTTFLGDLGHGDFRQQAIDLGLGILHDIQRRAAADLSKMFTDAIFGSLNATTGQRGGGFLSSAIGWVSNLLGGFFGGGASTSSGAAGGALGGTVGGFAFAKGGDMPLNTWSLVGEEGPELVRTGQPAHVFTNSETAEMFRSDFASQLRSAPQREVREAPTVQPVVNQGETRIINLIEQRAVDKAVTNFLNGPAGTRVIVNRIKYAKDAVQTVVR